VGSLRHAVLLCGCATLLCFVAAAGGRAESQEIDEVKGKIFDAHMAQQTFGGLKYCSELNGTSFYFQLRNRILNLEEYFHSLESLVKSEVYNPAKRRAWTLEDAKERWEEVKKQAQEDKRKCELVQGLPKLEKRLQELQAAAEKKE
jgi:tRNA nucleotidyltransferase/poly(A) polymerase